VCESWVWRFRTRSCTTGFGVGAIGRKCPGRWRRKQRSGRRGPVKRRSLGALQAEGLRRGEEVVFADEMRLGLLGQVRRVWGRRGEKLKRRVELRYGWVYLVLGVDPMKGRLWWDWVKQVRGVEIAQVLRAWYETMRLFPRRRRWERGGRPTLLNLAKWVFAEVRR
jgi:hypothetical protein